MSNKHKAFTINPQQTISHIRMKAIRQKQMCGSKIINVESYNLLRTWIVYLLCMDSQEFLREKSKTGTVLWREKFSIFKMVSDYFNGEFYKWNVILAKFNEIIGIFLLIIIIKCLLLIMYA